MPSSLVTSEAAFIMTTGPIMIEKSNFVPEPTQVADDIGNKSFHAVRTVVGTDADFVTDGTESSSRIIRSLDRAPMIAWTLLPAALAALVMGNNGAQPTPPPMTNRLPHGSMCVG